MMVKRKVLETVGLFDERFFFYFEDVDFCLRAGKYGYKIGVDREVIVYHKLGSSVGRWSKKAIMYNLISNYKFIRKNLGVRQITGLIYLFLLTLKIIYNRLVKHI
ncbi:glycosyltransferase family 2 protein [Candidatus Gottesmanbacteria bacterium]|nr:glycosyltransferase family 2 protein [Candidatus Gottesmanbacteria bacterium]